MKYLILALAFTFYANNSVQAAEQNLFANHMQIETTTQSPDNNNIDNTPLSEKANSERVNPNWASKAQEVLINALSLTGIKYRYGGNSPDTGFDCSGFVRYVFMQATNLSLPPTARAISQLGRAVSKDKLQPGDLVFFNTLKSTFSHVGIYIGDNRFIHSPRAGGAVRVEDLNTAYWVKTYNGAKRVDTSDAVVKE